MTATEETAKHEPEPAEPEPADREHNKPGEPVEPGDKGADDGGDEEEAALWQMSLEKVHDAIETLNTELQEVNQQASQRAQQLETLPERIAAAVSHSWNLQQHNQRSESQAITEPETKKKSEPEPGEDTKPEKPSEPEPEPTPEPKPEPVKEPEERPQPKRRAI